MNTKTTESYKYKEFVLTIKTRKGEDIENLPQISIMKDMLQNISETYTFQMECSENGMYHYQCCFISTTRCTVKYMLMKVQDLLRYPFALIEVDRAFDYKKAELYCSDEAKRVPGTDHYSFPDLVPYVVTDTDFLNSPSNWYPWEKKFMLEFFEEDQFTFKTPDDRTVYWVTDTQGNSGKSKWCKWLAIRHPDFTKLAFGSSAQLRESIIMLGPKKFYIIDIPRTLDKTDSMNAVISAVEDVKNGYIVSAMYGKPTTLIMQPPHVLVFSNVYCNVNLLSEDRWRLLYINSLKDWC